MYKWLDNWFDDLRENGLLKDAVVIFHGDHGSRICYAAPYTSTMSHPLWDRIVKDGFTTLFAVKDPGITKGKVEVAKPIEMLLKEFFLEREKLITATPENAFLLLLSDGEKKLKKQSFDQW